jgi:hypothetical protein
MSPREFGAFLAAQAQKWPPVIKAANIQPQSEAPEAEAAVISPRPPPT